jgi:hypothetical protein
MRAGYPRPNRFPLIGFAEKSSKDVPALNDRDPVHLACGQLGARHDAAVTIHASRVVCGTY